MTTSAPLHPPPQNLTVHAKSRVLELAWPDGAHFSIPFELLRIYSPSAEVQGHGPGQEAADLLDDEEIERSIREINEAIRRTAQKRG